MTYILHVHVAEAEPYTGLYDYDDIRAAVEEEARSTINELGSDFLESNEESDIEFAVELLADEAMTELWNQRALDNQGRAEFVLPGPTVDHETGRRRSGVRLSLVAKSEAEQIYSA